MINSNKAQNAVEFMIIFTFVLGLIALVMFVTGKYLVDANNQEKRIMAEDFAENINKELSILTQVDTGYYRELLVSEDNYEIVNITPSLLILKDVYNNETYYFDLIGDYSISVENRSDDVYLIFEKTGLDEEVEGIDLAETIIDPNIPAEPSNLNVLFQPSNACPVGYTKVFALNDLTNSHAEISSEMTYTYSLCLSHNSFSLGTNCNAAINTTLFYLGNVTDSHVYLNNSSAFEPHPGYFNWSKVCVSSSGGSANVVLSDTEPNINFVCVGSIWRDDVNGGMIGDCSTPSVPPYTKIWLSIDNPAS